MSLHAVAHTRRLCGARATAYACALARLATSAARLGDASHAVYPEALGRYNADRSELVEVASRLLVSLSLLESYPVPAYAVTPERERIARELRTFMESTETVNGVTLTQWAESWAVFAAMLDGEMAPAALGLGLPVRYYLGEGERSLLEVGEPCASPLLSVAASAQRDEVELRVLEVAARTRAGVVVMFDGGPVVAVVAAPPCGGFVKWYR